MKLNQPFTFQKRLESIRYALDGIHHLFTEEHNARIHFVAGVSAVFLGFFFNINAIEWLFVASAISAVIATELLNSAIERLTDMYTNDFDPVAGKVKDLAAGAVLMAAVYSIIVASFIFIPKLF